MDFSFLYVESIRGFTSTFVAIYSSNSYYFRFPPKIKLPHLDILKFIVNKFMNQDNKFAFMWVYEDVVLTRYSEFIRICHNKNIIVQTKGGDASSLNSKSEIPNKTLANITRAFLLNSIHKK